ncbi:hypothetical protein MRX56_05025 [Pseudodesulfovibrio sp. S3-i]|nr:hypothetical protein [Pseudodesulfovibrio sp. S3-i]MCJ2163908.1 hypothetical protein [Pseudodesulfovibrio sp. S3-i]
MTALGKAFAHMPYDVGLISEEEAASFSANGVSPGLSKTAEEEPYTVISTEDGHTIGMLRFPALSKDASAPSDELIGQLSERIAKIKDHVDLLIALSDWGWVAENNYLKENPRHVPDFLFGSGGGSGVNGRILADDRCVWVRPYDKGRSVAEVVIYKWPERNNSFAWKETNNYKTTSIGMNDEIKDDPKIEALLH